MSAFSPSVTHRVYRYLEQRTYREGREQGENGKEEEAPRASGKGNTYTIGTIRYTTGTIRSQRNMDIYRARKHSRRHTVLRSPACAD